MFQMFKRVLNNAASIYSEFSHLVNSSPINIQRDVSHDDDTARFSQDFSVKDEKENEMLKRQITRRK